VIDCGILVYDDDGSLAELGEGAWIAGTVWLGVDPFMYFDQLHTLSRMPALAYSWEIKRIGRQTSPFIEVAPKSFRRDASKSSYVEVVETDAWEDDGGHAENVLHCRKLDVPAEKHSSIAT
jgi:hypothetical protein